MEFVYILFIRFRIHKIIVFNMFKEIRGQYKSMAKEKEIMKIYEAADLMKNKIELLKTKRYKYVHTCIPSTKPKDRIKAD